MGDLYADIIVDISHEKLDKTFQYKVPDHLTDILEIGMCVDVPFGKGDRVIKGYVLELSDICKFDKARVKEIIGIGKKDVSIERNLIYLADWIRRYYGSTMIQSLKTVLPAKASVNKLEKKWIVRNVGKEELISCLGEAKRKKGRQKRVLLLEALLEQDEIPKEWLTTKLGVSGSVISTLEKEGIVRTETVSNYRNPVKNLDEVRKSEKHILSDEQTNIVKDFLTDYDNGVRNTYLIHGITGSGKTEVYMKLIEEVVSRGKQAIMLIPEIALTYQTLIRFYHRFSDRVSVINSGLSAGEKYDQCERAKNGELDVIIGPRSALFTPFPNLGLIIIDEEHENSYKSETTPKYHARETAIELARITNASVVLGSATPSVDAYLRANRGEYKLYKLNKRLTGGCLPMVYTVDLRRELKEGNKSIFSRKLVELLVDRLNKKEQSILFINRRGYAGFISCRSCGHVLKCPHCDVSLSEHNNGSLMCHYCGYRVIRPRTCPECGSPFIGSFKAGTQQIEEKLKEMFPGVRTLRMDADTTKTKESYEKILSAFANNEADVLIGTQMIVKGHDFPNVTLVGVLAADLSLGISDYRAGERTFQLLTQAVGRAGRGILPGEAVIQTYQPEHYAVVHASMQDYDSFYEEEVLYRDIMKYPPVSNLLAVQVYGKNEKNCSDYAARLLDRTKANFGDKLVYIGPAPASIVKINDIFRYVFYIKCEEYAKLVEAKDFIEDTSKKENRIEETIQFDFNPMNTL